jgi:hypothetical protein
MRRRLVATALTMPGSAVVLTGCDGGLIDLIESTAPSVTITVPALPIRDGGGQPP